MPEPTLPYPRGVPPTCPSRFHRTPIHTNTLKRFAMIRFPDSIKKENIVEGLAVMGFVFGMVGVVALVRLEKLTKTLKEKGILAEDYKEE